MEFYIADSQMHGKGLFAKSLIKKDDCYFFILPIVESYEGDKFFVFDKIYDLRGSSLEFINHSDNPNMDYTEIDGIIKIIALKDIGINEEITIDYGWSKEEKQAKGLINGLE